MESLPRVERSRKCLACGSEEHRQKDCPVKSGKPSTFPTTSAARTTERTLTSPTSQASAAVSKLQTEPEGETSPAKTGEPEVTAGQPVLSWEALLQAAAKVAGAVPSEPKAPSMKVVSISTTTLGSEPHAQALVDSGATHPLRRAGDHEEWRSASPVVVHLAGGEVVELKMNKAGTRLVPITDGPRDSSASPIVPLGALVGMLGYSMEWSGANCRLVSREGEVIKLKVRDGCPEVTEAQALSLIARIEDQKLEMLRQSVDVTKNRIRESVIALNKTWFDHLLYTVTVRREQMHCKLFKELRSFKSYHRNPLRAWPRRSRSPMAGMLCVDYDISIAVREGDFGCRDSGWFIFMRVRSRMKRSISWIGKALMCWSSMWSAESHKMFAILWCGGRWNGRPELEGLQL